mgnify:FL=1
MTDDILAQAEKMCDYDRIEAYYRQFREKERDALFEQGQKMIATGLSAIEEALAIALKMAQDRDAWKAKAIEERAVADFGGESEGQDYHIHFAKLPEEGEDVIVWGDVHIPTSKRGWREQASRELEAEMKHD